MALEAGKYISKELSAYINCWTRTTEFVEISKKHDMSDEMARKLARGDRKITENNKPLVLEIIALAIRNRNNKIPVLKKAHKQAVKLM